MELLQKDIKAVLFRSEERFQPFLDKLSEYQVDTTVLDFDRQEWINFDYSNFDFLIYYPSFKSSSNHPLALNEVYDNLMFIALEYPKLKFYPDIGLIKYYNDKYRQYLFLRKHNYPIPDTIPLFSYESVDIAEKKLGYPMVIKNRYGAGGNTVFRVFNRKELIQYYKLSKLDLFNVGAAKYYFNLLTKRIFYYHLIKEKKIDYPFLSLPLLAQKFIKIDHDLKTVVGDLKVVEGHWRIQTDNKMWKMNIDGGGIGQWSEIPEEALDLSIRLARDLKASWINLDLIISEDKSCMISEFSPVWHHYAYKEKSNFVYKEDYNIETPLEISLDLEQIIVESLIKAIMNRK